MWLVPRSTRLSFRSSLDLIFSPRLFHLSSNFQCFGNHPIIPNLSLHPSTLLYFETSRHYVREHTIPFWQWPRGGTQTRDRGSSYLAKASCYFILQAPSQSPHFGHLCFLSARRWLTRQRIYLPRIRAIRLNLECYTTSSLFINMCKFVLP